jgi:membrane protease YdiL (CAAX protease family)
MTALPPPIPGTAVGPSASTAAPAPAATLPLVAAVGAIGVLTASLIASKYLLDAIVGFGWPVAVYVAVLALIGYGPSLWWCRYASRRWGTGDLGADIGLTPRFADLGWGPVIWLGAIAAQVAVGALVVAFGVPLVGNTEGIEEISADRTYVVSLVITAVIAAPIVEEMVFRGVVMRGLRSRLPIVAVVVLQGLLFGAAHVDPVRGVGNIGLVLVLSGVGVAFGVAVALLGRIGPAMVAHALFNGAVLFVVLSGVVDTLEETSSATSVAAPPAACAASGGEQVGVVDQPDVTEASGDGEADPSGLAVLDLESVDRAQGASVDEGHVVALREQLVVDHPSGSVDDVGDRRVG